MEKEDKKTSKKAINVYEYEGDYRSDLEVHDNYIADFDAYEAMMVSKTYDSVSRKTKNGITDSDAATMIIERSARVVGQLPAGLVVAAGKKDAGKAVLMNILLQKWIYPNAKAQRPFLDKLRLWEQYSGVYGFMPMYYDWDVSPTGYVGPNCWLWNPRNFVPQQGRFTIDDMDYVHAISYLSHEEIEHLIENWTKDSGWNLANLKTLLEMSKNADKSDDTKRDSYTQRQRSNGSVRNRIQVVTRYEAGEDGKWIIFAPDFSCLELRNIDNPHKNGKIPFVIKPAIPLYDSFYNLSDMARAKPVQFAKDGLTNFYFEGIKMNIYPPTVINANGIVKHTVQQKAGAIWEEIIPNSARRLETSTAGLATYQAAMGQMSGALQNIFGTTTTQINAESAMSTQFGKTPEALKYQQGRESARDNQNRAYLQSAIEELIDRMLGLIPVMGTEEIPIDLLSEDIQEIIASGHDDVAEMLVLNESGETARLSIDPIKLKGIEYRFNMEPDSTIKTDKKEQRQSINDILDVLAKNANVLQAIQQTTGKMPNYEGLLKSFISLSDVPGIDEAFIDAPMPQQPAQPEQPQVPMDMNQMPMDMNQMPQTPEATTQTPLSPQIIGGRIFNDPMLAEAARQLTQ